jgi:anaerobic magnesium-protoporphyrin IX monomethyl ester cyclase
VRTHSTDYLVDQMTLLVERGITFFYLSDDTFTLNAGRVIGLCRKIIDRGLSITWQAISKVSAVNDEMLFWMRKAGCVQISYGVESGSPDIRKRLCKDIGHDQIVRAFERTVAHGILARAYFIYGAPGESWSTIEQTLALMRQIKPLSAIFYMMDLFPGTALYEDYKIRSGVDDDIWLQSIEDLLYFETDPSMDRETVLAYGRRLRESFDQALPEFARQIVLKDDADLYPEQADFLSRLGLTFSHGDYAGIQSSDDSAEVARVLFELSLKRHPDHRAFWGLALLHQRNGDPAAAIAVLKEGLRHHPRSQHLNICLGIGYANAGQYPQALEHLIPFDRIPEAVPHIVRCLRALGRHQEAAKYRSTQS